MQANGLNTLDALMDPTVLTSEHFPDIVDQNFNNIANCEDNNSMSNFYLGYIHKFKPEYFKKLGEFVKGSATRIANLNEKEKKKNS